MYTNFDTSTIRPRLSGQEGVSNANAIAMTLWMLLFVFTRHLYFSNTRPELGDILYPQLLMSHQINAQVPPLCQFSSVNAQIFAERGKERYSKP
jgi:hypothetical protein